MEELNVAGVAVGAEDYKEADKLVCILTPDLGVIRAVMRGVKKEKAKLKFAAMPFAFCEYSIVRRGAYWLVKSAAPLESLFGVTAAPEKYIAASVMLETAAEAAGETAAAEIFVGLLTSLKELIYSETDPNSLCASFVTALLVRGGYAAPPPDKAAPVSGAMLKSVVRLFENKFMCRIKSAGLL